MSKKILDAFRDQETFNILEFMLKLDVDKNRLKEVLNALIDQGKVKVEKKYFPRDDFIPTHQGLSSHSTIRGFYGDVYMLKK